MSDQAVQALIYAILGGGLATSIWTLVKSFIALRDNTDGREDRALDRLERFEKDCRDELACEREWARHWHHVAGILQHALDRAGIAVDLPPEPTCRGRSPQ